MSTLDERGLRGYDVPADVWDGLDSYDEPGSEPTPPYPFPMSQWSTHDVHRALAQALVVVAAVTAVLLLLLVVVGRVSL